MTIEERLKITLGEQQFQIVVLVSKLEEASKRITELEVALAAANPPAEAS